MNNREFDFSINILVADSDEASRRLLAETLAALGFNILQAGNINEAWKIISEQKIDLAMTDVALPDGNGIEFMLKLKKERPRIPVVVLSSAVDRAARDELVMAGADGVLAKPFRINLVEELITSTLMRYDKESLSTPDSEYKILVVDDDDSMLAFLTEAIKLLGYNIEACKTGECARQAFAKGNFALVISDFMLPDVNGIVLLKELRASGPDLPIVIVTGYALAYTPAMVKADGIDGYLSKPFRINQLEQVISTLLYPEKTPRRLPG